MRASLRDGGWDNDVGVQGSEALLRLRIRAVCMRLLVSV